MAGFVDSPDRLPRLADDALQSLMEKAGIRNHTGKSTQELGEWAFYDGLDHLDSQVLETCDAQIKFLSRFKENWRPQLPAKLKVPEDWNLHEEFTMPGEISEINLPQYELNMWVRHLRDRISTLSREETLARHFDPSSCDPDFLLVTAMHKDLSNFEYESKSPPEEIALQPTTDHSLEHFKAIVTYLGDERGAEAAISRAFMCIPGCWMRTNPLLRFPTSMMGTEKPPSVDFALLLDLIPFSRTRAICRDSHLRLALMHPALVVGIKGPVKWSRALTHSTALEVPKDMHEAVKDLARAVQPSLDAHLINWHLRREQADVPLSRKDDDLPDWFMMLGIIYDAKQIAIVAHIPFLAPESHSNRDQSNVILWRRFGYLSCVIDSIPFAPVSNQAETTQPWCADRFRAAVALFAVQKQAFRLSTLWERVAWPPEIVLAEAMLERECLGSTPEPEDPEKEDDENDPFKGWYRDMTESEQEDELMEEIRARDMRAQEVLPSIIRWTENLVDCQQGPLA